jgi:hypothetical protein
MHRTSSCGKGLALPIRGNEPSLRDKCTMRRSQPSPRASRHRSGSWQSRSPETDAPRHFLHAAASLRSPARSAISLPADSACFASGLEVASFSMYVCGLPSAFAASCSLVKCWRPATERKASSRRGARRPAAHQLLRSRTRRRAGGARRRCLLVAFACVSTRRSNSLNPPSVSCNAHATGTSASFGEGVSKNAAARADDQRGAKSDLEASTAKASERNQG